MLNKLLANLPFNPSLIGQISFYAKRLKQEASIRRLGFVMLLLAMAVQLFAFMAPPQPSLASSNNDLIYGGFTEQGQAVQHCLNTANEDFNIILQNYGISCQDLDYGHSSVVTINANDYNGQLFSMGRLPYGKPGEQPVNIAGANNGQHLYIRYLWGWGNVNYKALSLYMHGQQFFILFDCGNLVSVGIPTPPAPSPAPSPTPTPTPPTPPADKTSLGYLDVVNCTKIAGWAFDQDKPTAAITVRLYIDGNGDSDMTANQSRPDVGAAFPGAGNNHGYSMPTPNWIKNNKTHTFQLYALGIDANGNRNNVNPLIGSKTVNLGTCTTPAPPPTFTPGNASCESLKAIDLGKKSYSFVATTVGNEYNVKSYTFDFGDKTTKTVSSGLFIGSADHTYSKAGSYTAKVSILVNVQGTTSSTDKTITCQTNVTVTETSTPPTKPCAEAQSSDNLEACIVPHKHAKNVSQSGSDANGKTANAGETIEYTLTATNTGSITVPKFVVRENISDVLDYADERTLDLHGGSLDSHKDVTWPGEDIKAGATLTKLITVKIKDTIPDTPISSSDPGHFDHKMTNVYGDTVVINLPGNIVTLAQTVNGKLINTGPGTSMIAVFGLTMIVGYFFARSRLLSKEIDLVRSDYAATGGI